MPDVHLVLADGGRAGFLDGSMSKDTASTEVAVLKTSYGEMTIAFWPDVPPAPVENFFKGDPHEILRPARRPLRR